MKKEQYTRYIIIGAGLSGLTTAYKLQAAGETDFLLLEARPRTGGRILTRSGVDLGAAWYQSYHENLQALLLETGLGGFEQYREGTSKLIYNPSLPAHEFQQDQSQPASRRIAGGSHALIHALEATFPDKIRTSVKVTGIEKSDSKLSVYTETGVFQAGKVVVTLPPRLAAKLTYQPDLPADVYQAMDGTHTWMSSAIKAGITYATPFWRNKRLSGTLIGQSAVVTEMYDHSEAERYSLMGFLNEGTRHLTGEERREKVLDFLAENLGEEAREYQQYLETDWAMEAFTSGNELMPLYAPPRYGNPALADTFMNNRLLFSGTETSTHYGGYMEGAVYSGLFAADRLLQDKTV